MVVKLGIKELLNKDQTAFKELFTDYQPFYTINLLLDKELLPIQEMPKLGISEHEIVKEEHLALRNNFVVAKKFLNTNLKFEKLVSFLHDRICKGKIRYIITERMKI